MSKAKHTPGPWIFRKWTQTAEEIELMRKHGMEPTPNQTNDGKVFVSHVNEDPEGNTGICLVHAKTRAKKRADQWRHQCAERDANARLIAAAPELLEGLECIVDGMNPDAWESLNRITQEHILSAIAKAKGEI